MKISIVIPIYEGMDNAVFFFERCVKSVLNQTYRDFQIVVSDDSTNDWALPLITDERIKYIKNPNPAGMASNTNNAIDNADGEFIKILYQDDYFTNNDSLQQIADKLTDNTKWLVSGCIHDDGGNLFLEHMPEFNEQANTIGSPSVLTIHRDVKERFDSNLTWILDLDLYKRLYKLYGEPVKLNQPNVVIGLGLHQTTHKLTSQQKLNEEIQLT